MGDVREYCSEVYREQSGKLLRYLRRLGAGANAEDILQEVFVRFIGEASRDRIQKGSELRWLYRASRNLAIDYYRKNRKTGPLLDERAVHDPRKEDHVFREELLERMFTIARRCGDDYETLLHLILETKESQTSMAVILDRSERTVRRMTEKLFGLLEYELSDWRDYLSK